MRAKRDPREGKMGQPEVEKRAQKTAKSVAVVGRLGISFSLGLPEACSKVVGQMLQTNQTD